MSNIGIIMDVFSTEEIEELLSKYMTAEMLAGPHGTKHAFRTFMIAGKILAEMPRADPAVVICGSTFHDVGRIHDGADPLHGFRGVPRVLEIMEKIRNPDYPMLERNIMGRCDAWDVVKGKVADIVAYHPYSAGFQITLSAQIVCDADRLDRIRMGPDAVDPSLLALDLSRELIPWVRDLVKEYGA